MKPFISFAAFAVTFVLAGCAPLTVEQSRAMNEVMAHSFRSSQESLQRQQQQIWQQARSVQCVSRNVGPTTYTDCY